MISDGYGWKTRTVQCKDHFEHLVSFCFLQFSGARLWPIPQIPNSAAALQWFHPNSQYHQPCGFGWMKRITALHVPNPNPSKSVRIFCQAMCCLPNALVPATQKQRCLWNGRWFLVTCAFEVSTVRAIRAYDNFAQINSEQLNSWDL